MILSNIPWYPPLFASPNIWVMNPWYQEEFQVQDFSLGIDCEGGHFEQNDQKLQENYKLNIFWENH